MPQAVMVVAAVVGAGAAVASYSQQRKAAKAQSRAYAAQQRQADLRNARERRNTVRNARVARAQVEAQGVASGMMGGSAEQSSLFNIQGQLGQNLSFLDQNAQLSQEANKANQAAADYASRAAGYADLSKMASSFGNYFG